MPRTRAISFDFVIPYRRMHRLTHEEAEKELRYKSRKYVNKRRLSGRIILGAAYGTHPEDILDSCKRAGIETTLREIKTLRGRLIAHAEEPACFQNTPRPNQRPRNTPRCSPRRARRSVPTRTSSRGRSRPKTAVGSRRPAEYAPR